MTDPVIQQLTPTDIVGLTVYGEARSEGDAGMHAVASVIANRVAAQRHAWGLTPRDVCLAPHQFSCWSPAGGASNYLYLLDAARHLLRHLTPGPILQHCLDLAAQVVNGALVDSVQHATSYYSPDAMVPPGRVPAEHIGQTPVASIGHSLFFTTAVA